MSEPNEAAVREKSRGNGSRRKITYLVLMAVLIVGIAGGLFYWHQLRTTVSTDNAKVDGDLSDISPKVAGKVDKILVQDQEQVKAGQTLMVLDGTPYKIVLDQATANLALAQANYAKLPDDLKSAQAAVDKARQTTSADQARAKSAELSVADAERGFNQTQALFQSGATSKENLDAARSKLDSAQAALTAAQATVQSDQATVQDTTAKLEAANNTAGAIYQAQLQQAQAAYNSAKYNYDNCVIKAPISGTVVRIDAKTGENVASGQTVLTITDLENTWITANIEEGKIYRIKVGQPVAVTIDSYPGHDFAGEIADVGGATQSMFALIPTQNTSGNYTKVTQYLPVKIKVKKEGMVLKPGMSAVVKIHTAE
jgi:membrane fusion protein (multidrug efflux system)